MPVCSLNSDHGQLSGFSPTDLCTARVLVSEGSCSQGLGSLCPAMHFTYINSSSSAFIPQSLYPRPWVAVSMSPYVWRGHCFSPVWLNTHYIPLLPFPFTSPQPHGPSDCGSLPFRAPSTGGHTHICADCPTFSSVQSLSHVQLLAIPWIAARQASLSITNSRSSLKLTSIESVMPSSHLILCHPLLLLSSISPSIRVFSNESALRMRWPKYWSFSFSISPSDKHSGLVSFRMDWLDLLAVQGTL